LGSYEYDKAQRFAESLHTGNIVYDVGAHAGFYTLLASHIVGPAGRVFAFEPLPRNVRYLKRHVELNRAKNAIIIEAAVTDASGTCSFLELPASLEGHISSEGRLSVRSVSLDDLFTSGSIPAPDVIKIDVEGAETMVLAGASALLERHHPLLFLAVHGDYARVECCTYLRSMGYTLGSLDGLDLDQTSELLARPPSNHAGIELLT
jgi:FkbM family methyltransferase